MPNRYALPAAIVLDDTCKNLHAALESLKSSEELKFLGDLTNKYDTKSIIEEKAFLIFVCLDLSAKLKQSNLHVLLEIWWMNQQQIHLRLYIPMPAATQTFTENLKGLSDQLITTITDCFGSNSPSDTVKLTPEYFNVIPVLMQQGLRNQRIGNFDYPPLSLEPWPSSPPPTLLNLSHQQVWMGVAALSCALIVISVFSFGAPAALAALAAALSISQAAAAMAVGSTALATGAGLAFAGFEFFKRQSRISLAKQTNAPLPNLISYSSAT